MKGKESLDQEKDKIMAIDKNIYYNGVKGLLSYYEISSLPKDYEVYKPMFWEATMSKDKKNIHIPMSKLQEEWRMMKVIEKASYGMHKYEYGNSKIPMFIRKTWIGKILFYLNPVRLWRMWDLKRNLKMLWHKDRDKYFKVKKELEMKRKELEETRPKQYDITSGSWRPIGTC